MAFPDSGALRSAVWVEADVFPEVGGLDLLNAES